MTGTDRDCVHAIDLFFNSAGASLPEVVITDTGSYSDLDFGIAQLLGVDYRPALADLPDQKGWRADTGADYGPLNIFVTSTDPLFAETSALHTKPSTVSTLSINLRKYTPGCVAACRT